MCFCNREMNLQERKVSSHLAHQRRRQRRGEAFHQVDEISLFPDEHTLAVAGEAVAKAPCHFLDRQAAAGHEVSLGLLFRNIPGTSVLDEASIDRAGIHARDADRRPVEFGLQRSQRFRAGWMSDQIPLLRLKICRSRLQRVVAGRTLRVVGRGHVRLSRPGRYRPRQARTRLGCCKTTSRG